MTINATVIETPDRPTSHVELGKTKLGGVLEKGSLVELSFEGGSVAFRADPVDDTISSTISRKVRVNERLAETLLPPVDRTEFVASRITKGDVATADRVEINPRGNDPDELAQLLRSREALLHPVAEEYDLSRTAGETKTVQFTVTDLSPARTTVRVTGRTSFEFTTTEDAAKAASDPGDIAGRPSSAGDGEESDDGGGDEDASISLTPTEPQTSFEEDVAGLEEVKRTAQMMLSLFDPSVSEQIVARYGEEFADRGGGMLLYGPPGCGKTLVSEAIAHEAKHNTNIESEYGEVVFLEVRGSDVVSKYAGESEKNVEAAFEQAHELASDGFAVLFFDEVETLIPDRSDDNLQRHERALTNAFLQQMNDVEDNLLVIGATNMPFSIDPAATRRFPIQQFIPQPDEEVMAEVWRKSLGKIAGRGDVDCAALGRETVGYTPAEIADRVLGSDLQRELVESVARSDREPIEPNTAYLQSRLDETEPKTVRQYVSSVLKQAQELEGFPKMKQYVESEARRLGMMPGSPAGGSGTAGDSTPTTDGSGTTPTGGAGSEQTNGEPPNEADRGQTSGERTGDGGAKPPSGAGGEQASGANGGRASEAKSERAGGEPTSETSGERASGADGEQTSGGDDEPPSEGGGESASGDGESGGGPT